MELRIAGLAKESVVDGPGLRFVIFAQGCPHHCLGCHNPQTHDPKGGKVVAADDLLRMIGEAKLIRGVTFSGGEPFLQATVLSYLAKHIHGMGLNVVTYTGFLFEQLLGLAVSRKEIRSLLQGTDILIDGPYVAEKRDLRLAFRGSSNQRIIDVQQSLAQGQLVLWQDETAANFWV